MSIHRLAVAVAVLAVTAIASRAQDYPTRPVTIVIPFAAGGAGDILARMLSPRLEKAFGKPFVVENKPGAGGVIGAVATAKAAPDGHTIMIAPSPVMAVNVTLFKHLAYDPAADFVPLAMAAQTPFVLVVNPSLPVKSVADLIAYVKAQKGKVSYAHRRPGRAASSVRRAAQVDDRDRDVAGALQGQRSRHHRRRGRSRAADVRRPRAGAVDHPGRQGARGRGVHREADPRRCPTCRRSTIRSKASTWRPGRWSWRRRRRRAPSSTGCMPS